MLNFLLYFLCVLSCMLSIDSFAASQEDGPQPMRISLRHIENKGVGYNTGYTTLETFLASSWTCICP